MADDTMAALRDTLLDRPLRFTTRTDLSVTATITLKRGWNLEANISAPKQPKKLPVVLSRAEVLHFLGCSQRTRRWREADSNRRPRGNQGGIRLLTFDHEELVGCGFGPPNLAFATSKLPHVGVAVG